MLAEEVFKIIFLVTCVACASVFPPKPRLDGTIVGGIAINITDAPWQVSLQSHGSHTCGGSIISPKWIVTAAHCAQNANNLQIRAGSSLHNKDGELFDVKRVIRHPRYNSPTIDYDFSLLELEEPLEFDESKQSIKLHNFDENFGDGTTCVISGWGNTQDSSESRLVLRKAEIPIVNQQECINAYKSVGGVTPRMICAGLKEGGKDSCQGDSGGPLSAFSEIDGKPRLVGIVSWGYGCARPNYPGVYGRVLAAREWIFENSGI